MDVVFQVLNNSVMPAWLLLVFAPRWKWTQKIVHSAFIPGLLAVAYGFLLFSGTAAEGAGFSSLAQVTQIFRGSPEVIIACWVHYLVFDLFVGAWEARDCQRLGLPHLAVVPSMILTLLFGPLGLLSWLLIRGITRKRASLLET